MAKRYIGDAVITINYKGGLQDEYVGTISAPGPSGKRVTWKFAELYPPRSGFNFGYDSAKAYDKMAASAANFGSYYSTMNRGSDTPSWAPSATVADAIEAAVAFDQDDQGNYRVRRSK